MRYSAIAELRAPWWGSFLATTGAPAVAGQVCWRGSAPAKKCSLRPWIRTSLCFGSCRPCYYACSTCQSRRKDSAPRTNLACLHWEERCELRMYRTVHIVSLTITDTHILGITNYTVNIAEFRSKFSEVPAARTRTQRIRVTISRAPMLTRSTVCEVRGFAACIASDESIMMYSASELLKCCDTMDIFLVDIAG